MRSHPSLVQVVLQALENERCLDLRYRQLNPELVGADRLPNYKVMKQVALRRRFGALYPLFILLAQWAMPLLSGAQWVAGLLRSLRGRSPDKRIHAIATAPANRVIIEAGLKAAGIGPGSDANVHCAASLAAALGWRAVLCAIGDHIALLVRVLALPRGIRGDTLLHTRDGFSLLLLARFARTFPDHVFATDDHYQRWAFVLSHCSANLVLVQHGYLDRHIKFAHPFGALKVVCIRDESFAGDFLAYYVTEQLVVFSSLHALVPVGGRDDALFLASSFPSIDQEIALLRLLSGRLAAPVIVKFHPSHSYDDRKALLAELASHTCSPSDYPQCQVFVSFNSFMEYDYRALGKATVAIARCDDVAAAADAVVAAMAAPPRPISPD